MIYLTDNIIQNDHVCIYRKFQNSTDKLKWVIVDFKKMNNYHIHEVAKHLYLVTNNGCLNLAKASFGTITSRDKNNTVNKMKYI